LICDKIAEKSDIRITDISEKVIYQKQNLVNFFIGIKKIEEPALTPKIAI